MVCSVPVRNQSKPTKLFRTELEILNVQSEQQRQRDDNLRLTQLCPANLLFVEVIQLGLQNQKSLMHAINDPSTNIRPAFLTAVNTSTHWAPIFAWGL